MKNLIPTDIKLLQKSRVLEIMFANGKLFLLPCELLRVYSPSAEVKGHGGQGGKLPIGKENVNIVAIEPVGNYAIKLIFDDEHQTGLYAWDYLYDLGINQEKYWNDYRNKVKSND